MATLSPAQIGALAQRTFGDLGSETVALMTRIALLESSGRTDAYNGTGRDRSTGLWQINIRMPQNGETGAPAPSNTLPIIVRMRDIPSNIGPTSQLGLDQFMNVPNGQITTLAFK